MLALLNDVEKLIERKLGVDSHFARYRAVAVLAAAFWRALERQRKGDADSRSLPFVEAREVMLTHGGERIFMIPKKGGVRRKRLKEEAPSG